MSKQKNSFMDHKKEKDADLYASRFLIWEDVMEAPLTHAHKMYCKHRRILPYHQFCEQVWNRTLPGITKNWSNLTKLGGFDDVKGVPLW